MTRCPKLVMLLLAGLLPAALHAQESVTLTGRVTAGTTPLRGATVRIEQLGLRTTTNAEGRYDIIVSSSRVRGQTVTLTARYLRYRPQSVSIVLTGGALVRDFDLAAPGAGPPTVAAPGAAAAPAPSAGTMPAPGSVTVVDSSAFVEAIASLDLPGALAGRVAGAEVHGPGTFGGNSVLQLRGARTLAGVTQPLYVVDGVLVEDVGVTPLAQRMGLGGFDYGSGIADIDLADVERVEVLRGPAAAMRFGGRAANGVVLVTTRDARGLNGFVVSANQRVSFDSPLRLPEYQDLYGQGLGGQFAFFDGRGGGVNDSVAQSWGPALLGQPIPQASLTEAARPDVRFWTAQPANVRDWLENGLSQATHVVAQGANDRLHGRLSLANRTMRGFAPEASLGRQSAVLTAGSRLAERFTVDGALQVHRTTGADRPGTGIDEGNTFAMFSRMGRQVDVAALRDHLRDAQGNQVSWNYAGQNNPWFAPLENSNEDTRTHVIAGLHAALSLHPALQLVAQAGTDRVDEERSFTVAPGWMGGFPYFGGEGSFAGGGSQDDAIGIRSTNATLSLRGGLRSGAAQLGFDIGGGWRSSALSWSVDARDDPGGGDPAVTATQDAEAHGRTPLLFASGDVVYGDFASVNAAVRHERPSVMGASASQLYPSVLATLDLARLQRRGGGSFPLGALALRAGWARSGNDVGPLVLQRLGALPPTGAPAGEILAEPEITTGWEIGAGVGAAPWRATLDVTYYDERTENLVLPGAGALLSARGGSVCNSGIEARLGIAPLNTTDLGWRIEGNVARNTSTVESMAGAESIELLPGVGGVSIAARTGEPLGVLVGTAFRRAQDGSLLLQDGLPVAGPGGRVVGNTAPDLVGGIGSTLRYRWVELGVLFDIRRGGQVFSATNMAGAYAGTLAETAFRPDSGLLVAGTDAATGGANTTHVTTEAYYHALGSIGERWVYDGSFAKLREARVSLTVPLHGLPLVRAQSLRLSVVGRNLALWASAPNVDPELATTSAGLRGAEMGQHPSARSVGFQVTLTP